MTHFSYTRSKFRFFILELFSSEALTFANASHVELLFPTRGVKLWIERRNWTKGGDSILKMVVVEDMVS